MTGMSDTCLIGVDGGGTGCRVALVVNGRRYDTALGPANATTDQAGAVSTVAAGITSVLATAGLGQNGLRGARAQVGLAGIMSKADAQAMERDLRQKVGQGISEIRVCDDRETTVAGALGRDDGAVAGIGTGSFLARQVNGSSRFIGGWGLALGDEASGAWLGRCALAATLQVVDGFAERSALSDQILARFGTPARIVAFVTERDPSEIGALAPLIVDAAKNQDSLGQSLMQNGARYIQRGFVALGRVPGQALCLTGGLGAAYVPWLEADIGADLRAPLGTALDGAVLMAGRERAPR